MKTEISKLPPKTKLAMLKAAAIAVATPGNNEFWKTVEAQLDKQSNLIETRKTRTV